MNDLHIACQRESVDICPPPHTLVQLQPCLLLLLHQGIQLLAGSLAALPELLVLFLELRDKGSLA